MLLQVCEIRSWQVAQAGPRLAVLLPQTRTETAGVMF